VLKHNADLTGAVWRKSTRSGGNGNCVEVAKDLPYAPGLVAVRDSKDRNGPALVFTTAEWAAFVGGIQDGELH
jgi:hypothetical protein